MTTQHHQYVIIGAGPAGLQLGYFFEKAGLDYCILEGSDHPGSFFSKFPRHRQLISINKIYTGYDDPILNMRWDWNSLISDSPDMLFKEYSKKYFPHADELVKYLHDFAAFYKLKIQYNARVENISRGNNKFAVTTKSGDTYGCEHLIVATGLSRPLMPMIKGIELCENYFDISVNPDDFINQRVLIIGKGNSAFETADNLIATAAVIHLISPSVLNFAWKTHYVGHLRAVNNNLLDTYQLKSQNALINGDIEEIIRDENGRYTVRINYSKVKGGETEDIMYDRIIICAGFKMDASIFGEGCQPKLMIKDKFPQLNSRWESVNVPNMFFAGNLTHSRDFRKTTSGFIHGFRYNAEALFNILQKENHNQEFDTETIQEINSGNLMEVMIRRVNLSSALWQQFGFLGDVLIVNKEQDSARYIGGLPVAYINETLCAEADNYFIMTLEYGHTPLDPFSPDLERVNKFDVANAAKSLFLHPVVRQYARGQQVAELHLIEDFRSEFNRAEHTEPLREFFSNFLVGLGLPSSTVVA